MIAFVFGERPHTNQTWQLLWASLGNLFVPVLVRCWLDGLLGWSVLLGWSKATVSLTSSMAIAGGAWAGRLSKIFWRFLWTESSTKRLAQPPLSKRILASSPSVWKVQQLVYTRALTESFVGDIYAEVLVVSNGLGILPNFGSLHPGWQRGGW